MNNLKIEKKQGSAANTNWLNTNSRQLKVANYFSKPLWFHKYTLFFADASKKPVLAAYMSSARFKKYT